MPIATHAPGKLVIAALLLVAAAASAQQSSYDDDVKNLDSKNPSEREAASKHLQQGGAASRSALIENVDKLGLEARQKAIWLFTEISRQLRLGNDDDTALKISEKARKEENRTIRGQMLLALMGNRSGAATQELKRFAAEDSDPGLRILATHGTAKISRSDERDFLRAQLRDPDPGVQLAAYGELAKLGDYSGRDKAIAILKAHSEPKTSSDWATLDEAARLLGGCGKPEDIALLKSIAETRHPRDPDLNRIALDSYLHIELLQLPNDRRLQKLILSLDDKRENVRQWAYLELYHSTDPSVDAALTKYLNEPGHVGIREASMASAARAEHR